VEIAKVHGSGIGDVGSGQRRGRWAEFPRGGKRGRHQSSNALIGTPKAKAEKAAVSFVVAGSDEGAGVGGGHSGGGGRIDVGEEVGGGTEGEYSDVAMRLMMKMGYKEGSGLGKDGEGMREPILAVKRPRQMGLGVVGVVGGKDDVGGGDALSSGGSVGRVKLVRPRAGKAHAKKAERGRKDERREKMENGGGGKVKGRGKWPPPDPASARASALALAGIGGNKHTKREFRSMLSGVEKRGLKRRF
jgi:hypothetical protein